ncbi:3-[(3aS,4S,7aS)-7a-methyl-1,5-dioxo-octahydro-1H-inden-4-yl]propanoyl:CoA ligase-like [Saccostrea echinata]|uniref:3-[(3aS,4S,7aS)-7a-methyl-1, 5-dioxo-octahydro-1H-inden-4-yl]propanoyl:CoA ligase-like n=1 Tax=Saccostrea echinata TaxID=191078 RepID=UPI002A816204|nr:3-[(3aS,4S,7aS)-7a-methyl-1,5-dioxo-octahydro-1H-inden-4-yl]propanoyl:CoA ligase-like [Saccostrea echinata]
MENGLSYIRSQKPIKAPYTTIPKLVKKWASLKPENEACVFYNQNLTRKSITYGQLYENSIKLAKGLVHKGIGRDDIVGVGGNNTPEWLVSTFAVQLAGARPIHFPFLDKSGNGIKDLLNSVGGCSMLIFDPGHEDSHWKTIQNLATVDPETGSVKKSEIICLKWIVLESPLSASEKFLTISDLFCDEVITLPEIDPEDTASILITSGSTGLPKAVECSHYFFIQNAHKLDDLMDTAGILEKQEVPIYLNDRPFFWIGGYPCWCAATGGIRVTLSSTLAFSSIADMVYFSTKIAVKEKANIGFFIVPFLLEMIAMENIPWKFHSILTGAQPIPAHCLLGIGKNFDVISDVYAASELGVIAQNTYRSSSASVGKFAAEGMEIKVVGSEERMLPLGENGEILVRSSPSFRGYLKNEERTKEALISLGWYKTDDFGHITRDGRLEILGRVSDVMLISGLKVLPSAIESIIKKHPDVKEVVVFPIKDVKHADDIPCAAIVRKDGATETEEALREFVRRDMNTDEEAVFLENIYVPKYIVFHRIGLPKTQTGKIDRSATRRLSIPLINNE